MAMYIHYRDVRMFAKHKISFPMCHAKLDMAKLDMTKARLPWTTMREAVTCPRCKRRMFKGQPPPPPPPGTPPSPPKRGPGRPRKGEQPQS